MERSANETVAIDSWIPDFHPLQDSCVSVIIDIETTGLGKKAEIIQIAAKSGVKDFGVYMSTKTKMSGKASEITGLTTSNQHVFYRGQKMETIPSDVGARRFLDFLHGFNSQILLVGHNIRYFDFPLILKWLNKHGLLKELCSLVYGITDTSLLMRQDNTGKQEKLAEKNLVGPDWDIIRAKAHNAVTDCIILDGLMKHFQIDDDILKKKAISMRDFCQQRSINKNQKKNMSLVSDLKPIVSRILLRRMARHGLTIDKLKSEYLKYGDEKIKAHFTMKFNGRARVTLNKRVTQAVIDYIRKLVDSEKEGSSKVKE